MNNNLIVVGGPISVGKSTVVQTLPYIPVSELDDDNELQMILLEQTYDKGRVAPEVIESFFLINRSNKYKEFSKKTKAHVLDRSIFESLWFAKGNMNKKSFDHFETLWNAEINDLIKNYGKPKIYILLTMNWKTFKQRLFTRGRNVEIKNFKNNKVFFKKHINEYEKHMICVFEKFGIKYAKVHTDKMNQDQVLESVLKQIGRNDE